MDAIENAASLYIWDNVSKYDIRFRRHMEKYRHRNWADRYTKAYEESMTDPIAVKVLLNSVKKQSNYSGSRKPANACWRFNKHGKCDLGLSCTMEHKCSFCGKFGHFKKNCHKFKQQQNLGDQSFKRSEQKPKDRN